MDESVRPPALPNARRAPARDRPDRAGQWPADQSWENSAEASAGTWHASDRHSHGRTFAPADHPGMTPPAVPSISAGTPAPRDMAVRGLPMLSTLPDFYIIGII